MDGLEVSRYLRTTGIRIFLRKRCAHQMSDEQTKKQSLINVVAMLLVFSVLFIASAGGEGGGCKEQSVVQPFGL